MLFQSAALSSLFLSITHPAAVVMTVNAFVVAPSTTRLSGGSSTSSPPPRSSRRSTVGPLAAARSLVSDPAGPTPALDEGELETVRLEDIPEMEYDPDNRPVPHQTWRRGITDGCEDPIDAPWRLEAEDLIQKSVQMVGGTVLDVTWYLTQVVVHIEDDWEKVPRDYLKTRGPPIDIMEPENPLYYDPDDPNPEPIYSDRPEDPIYIRDTAHEEEMDEKRYARAEVNEEDLGLEPDKISLYTKEEYREAEALRYAEEVEQRYLREERPMEADHLKIDTAVLSTIAGAIMEALETVEDRLRVLDRHEVVLTSPGAIDVLETQRQFDDHRGWDILVETQDPWDSNRTLRGKLVDRNSMDIILNVKGRMVTVPQNFVRCVRLPAAKRNDDPEAFAEAEEDYDEEGGFEEEDIYE